MVEHQQSEKSIFLAALEIEAGAERAVFLEQACEGNRQQRAEIEALLQAHETPQRLLDTTPPPEPRLDQITAGPGTVVGPYKLLEKIGEGGMGTVWMAQQTEPVKRLVALKLIRAGMDSKQVIARFEAERQALALMDHPNIARVLDAGTTDSEFGGVSHGRPYFVMELVKGQPITKYCDEHHLTPQQRLELFVPVCQAIQHAHQKGIIHRDLKPSNVLIALYDGKPVPKVIDFGVSKAAGQPLTEQTLVTGFGAIVGTLEYMSPEQAEFNQLDIDTRSDIYSLGVLLYELLVGSTPFTRKDLEKAGMLEMLRVIREQEPTKPSTKLSTAEGLQTLAANRGTEPAKLTKVVRGELDWIVMKALEKDRKRRYETANAFAMDVQRYLVDEPVLAYPPTWSYRLRKLAIRNRTALASIAALAVILVAGSALSTWLAVRATQAEKLAAGRLNSESDARYAAEGARALAQRRLFDARLHEARARRASAMVGARAHCLAALAEAAQLAESLELDAGQRLELRNEVIACLALPDVQVVEEWDAYPVDSRAIAFAPDLRYYARGDIEGVIRIHRVDDRQEIARLHDSVEPYSLISLQFSADNRYLGAFHESPGGRHVSIWDLESRRICHRSNGATCVSFSVDGKLAAVARAPAKVELLDLETSTVVRTLTPRTAPRRGGVSRQVSFDPEGQRLAIWDGDGQNLEIWSVASVELVSQVALPAGVNHLGRIEPFRIAGVAWHPRQPLLAISQRGIYLWNFAAGAVAEVLSGHEATSWPVFSPTGDLLASSSWDGTVRLWHPSGRQIASMPGNQVFVGRDGRLVVRHGTRLALLHVGQGPECRSHDDHGAKVFTQLLAIEPRSRVLVSAGATGIYLWDLARGSMLSRVPGNIHSVAFAPDGQTVLTAGPTQADRWPIQWHSDGTRLVLGPPEKIATPVPRPTHWSVLSADGRFLTATTSLQTAQVVDLKTGAIQCRLQSGGHLTRIAISADQRWAASGSWHGVEALVWDFRSGAVVHRFPHEFGLGHSYVAFSPNSNWFVLCLGSDYRLIEPGSWTTKWRVSRDQQLDMPGPVAFSPHGRLVALTRKLQVVTLVDLGTGAEVAQLSSPHRATIAEMCFSPDGRYLVAGGDNAIHVWDVHGIRRRLAGLGLDWDASPLPSDDRPAMPVRVDLNLGALAPARK